jgi:hypothetical protein
MHSFSAQLVVIKRKKCVAYPQEDFLFTICMETPEGHKKIRMEATRWNLQAQPKILKK